MYFCTDKIHTDVMLLCYTLCNIYVIKIYKVLLIHCRRWSYDLNNCVDMRNAWFT